MLKAFSWAMVVGADEEPFAFAFAFTLRLGPEVRQDIPAGKLADHLRDRIRRELRTEFGDLELTPPEFFISIEAPFLGETHVHGACTMPDDPRGREALRKALKRAGGKWPKTASGRQLDTQLLTTPVRWMSYITKSCLYAEMMLGGPVVAASSGLRGKDKLWYQAARQTKAAIRPGASYLNVGMIDLGLD
jgi:hypothetical protein